MTGTVYSRPMPKLPGADEPHQVPSGFSKIVIVDGKPTAYFFDQETYSGTDFKSGKTTVAEIAHKDGNRPLTRLEDSCGCSVPRLIAPSLGSCVAALSLRFYVGRSVASRPPNPVQPLRSLRSLQAGGVLFSQSCGLLIGFRSLVCLVCGAAVCWCAACRAAVLLRCCGCGCAVVLWCCGGGGAAVLCCLLWL